MPCQLTPCNPALASCRCVGGGGLGGVRGERSRGKGAGGRVLQVLVLTHAVLYRDRDYGAVQQRLSYYFCRPCCQSQAHQHTSVDMLLVP